MFEEGFVVSLATALRCKMELMSVVHICFFFFFFRQPPCTLEQDLLASLFSVWVTYAETWGNSS